MTYSPTSIPPCQVASPTVVLPCPVREGVLRCERLDAHTTGHYITDHTREHALAGNGYACSAVQVSG